MCLYSVTKRTAVDNAAEGYKLCRLVNGRILPLIYTPKGDRVDNAYSKPKPIALRVWLESDNITNKRRLPLESAYGSYLRGFHVCEDVASTIKFANYLRENSYFWPAQTLIAVPVRCKEIHTYGTQEGANVFVCNRIRFEHGCIKRGTIIK